MLRLCDRLDGLAETLTAPLSVETHHDAVLVPLRIFPKGGLFAASGDLIEAAAHYRGPARALPNQFPRLPVLPDQPARAPAGPKYIYAGCVTDHYGHCLFSFLPRLWPIPRLRDPAAKYVLMNNRGANAVLDLDFVRDILSCAGLSKADFVWFDRPTRFDTILVPQPAAQENLYAHPSLAALCARLGRMATLHREPPPVRKCAYISKTRLRQGVHRICNEDALEEAMAQGGADVVHPETLSFRAQVSLFQDYQVVAGVVGSAMHTTLFSGAARLVMLNCSPAVNSNQILIDRIVGNRSLYLHPDDTEIVREPDGAAFQNTWRLTRPRRTAREFYQRVQRFAAGDATTENEWHAALSP